MTVYFTLRVRQFVMFHLFLRSCVVVAHSCPLQAEKPAGDPWGLQHKALSVHSSCGGHQGWRCACLLNSQVSCSGLSRLPPSMLVMDSCVWGGAQCTYGQRAALESVLSIYPCEFLVAHLDPLSHLTGSICSLLYFPVSYCVCLVLISLF